MLIRIFFTLILLPLMGGLSNFLNDISTVASSQAAGLQFENSDTIWLSSMFAMRSLRSLAIPGVLYFLLLVVIWWGLVKAKIAELKDNSSKSTLPALAIALILAVASSTPTPAQAYYDKSDYAEPYFILPNESAFFVPDVGDNKKNQASMNTEQYYSENKISARRFLIPHTKLENSGLFSNFYVPSGRLLIVDHIPYHREWTASTTTGTSAKNQSIKCQSSEGIDVQVEVSVTASIKESDAAKYLYYFGIQMPKGDRTDPQVIFSSIYHARALGDVMDNFTRGKVVTVVCREISSRTLDSVNRDAPAIMAVIEKETMEYLKPRGITLDSIGWAGTFDFAPDIQKAINDRYIGNAIASALPSLERVANIEVKRGLAEGLKKGLPPIVPQGVADFINSIFRPGVVSQEKK